MNSSKTRILVLTMVLIFVSSLFLGSASAVSAAPSQSGGANYINVSEANITFTGNVTNDFSGHQIYENTHATPWGPDNNLTALYVSFNSTYLFIGVKEIIDGNSLMVFLSNDTNTQYGTYNMTNLNTWNRAISFTSPVNYFAAVYFGGPNSDPSGEDAFMVNSPLSASNTSPSAVSIQNYFVFGGSNNTVEIRIPWQALFPYGYSGTLHMNISAFIVGGSGAWVGIGMPYSQVGKYNDGNSISEFVVNDTIGLNFGQVNIPSTVKTTTPTAPPINLAIIFNDHQPLYKVVGSNYYVLPWTEAHATAEYIEQALIAHMFPEVNVTYELSGSLLYQLVNISTDPEFNDTFIHYAFVPYSELNTTQNRSLLANLTYDYFSIPSYVFSLNEPASNLYAQLHSLWVSGKTLNATQFEDAKVLWFLYDVSTPLVEGQLGAQWKNSTIWALHNQTSFNQTDLKEILQYSKWLTGQVIPAFRSDMQGNTSGSNNVELFTSPFYHPLTPLLLANNLTGPAGTIYKASYFSDVLAQMNISRGQFYHLFGQWPTGMYAPEFTVSYQMIQAANESGAIWMNAADAALQGSGIDALPYGNGGNVTQMLNLYTPYKALGPNNTSIYVFFRDGYISNDWAFNFGSMPTWTAVDTFINYLKGIYSAIPASDHEHVLVTVGLDGENWMFMSPFAEDGVPFLEDLYTALEQNSTYIHTVTPQQYLEMVKQEGYQLPVLKHIATAGWNGGNGKPAPYQSNIYLTQWSGYQVQDFYWEALNNVRSLVLNFQEEHNLVQLQNYTPFEQNLTANTLEGNLTRAWNAIYAAEGSDWFFQMAPWTISGSNSVPFDYLFKGDLMYALRQLNIPVPNYLNTPYTPPVTPASMGDYTQAHTPTLNGYPWGTVQTSAGLASSPSLTNPWNGTIVYYNNTSKANGNIRELDIAYSPTTLYLQIYTYGNASVYGSVLNDYLSVYFSGANPFIDYNLTLDVPNAAFSTVYSHQNLDFAAQYAVELLPATFSNGEGYYGFYVASGFNSWRQDIDIVNPPTAYARTVIQLEIPLTYLNYVPGDSFFMGVYLYNGTSGTGSYISPVMVKLPISLAEYTPISSIHNTVPPNGDGNYTYPDQPTQIPPGSLDLEYINVSANQFDMKWVFTYAQLWNIWDGPLGFSNQIINIFISDGSSTGSYYLGTGPNANSTVPWQTMIYISGWSTYVLTPSGEQTQGVITSANLSARTITVIVPLSYIGSNFESYKYIIVAGSYDGYGVNGWRVVDQTNTTNGGWQGGGGNPPWSSNIYTYIAPATVGEGSLTQQQALSSFSATDHKYATLVPISLPLLRNVTTTSHTQISPVENAYPQIYYSNGMYYMFYLSNATGTAELYVSTSSNAVNWSEPVALPGADGSYISSLYWGSNVYVLLGSSSGLEILNFSTLSPSDLSNYLTYHLQIAPQYATMYISGSTAYILSSYTNGSGYSYSLLAFNMSDMGGSSSTITGSDYLINRALNLSGNSYGYISGWNSHLYVAFYSYNGSYDNIGLAYMSTGGNLLGEYTYRTYENLTGIDLSVNSYGNAWIIYSTGSSAGYGLYVTNITVASAMPRFSNATSITTSPNTMDQPFLYIVQNGRNDSLLIAWHGVAENQNVVWGLRSSISWYQSSPVTTPPKVPAKSFPYTTVVIAVVVVAVVAGIAVAYAVRIRR